MHRPNKTAALVLLAAAVVIALPVSGLSPEPTPTGPWQLILAQLEIWLGWSDGASADPDVAVRNASATGGGRWDPNGLTGSNDGESEDSASASSTPTELEGGGELYVENSGPKVGGSD